MSGFNPGNNHKQINHNFSKLSEDQLYWLHEQLFPQKQSERNILNINLLKSECLEYLEYDKNSEINISKKLETFEKISKKFFNWVSDSDIRKLIWVKNKIKKELQNTGDYFLGIKDDNNIKTKFRLCVFFEKFDYVTPSINNQSLNQTYLSTCDKKIKFIENIKEKWDDWEILTDNFSKWLEKSNQDTLQWCFNYISKKESFPTNIDDGKNITPIMILILIDSLNFENIDSYTLYIERLKKSWSQYKFKSANKVKSKYHLPLTKQAKFFLDELATLKNKSEADMLEELLKKEYQNLMCDKKGNPKYGD